MAKATLNKTGVPKQASDCKVDWANVQFPVEVYHPGYRRPILLLSYENNWIKWYDAGLTTRPYDAGSNNGQQPSGFERGVGFGVAPDLSALPQLPEAKPEITGVTLELTVEEAAVLVVATGYSRTIHDVALHDLKDTTANTRIWGALRRALKLSQSQRASDAKAVADEVREAA